MDTVSPPRSAPHCDLDFFGDAALTDPVSQYHRMLAAGPVVWLPRNDLHAVCGYDALTNALRNHRVFRSGLGVSVDERVNEFLIGSTLNSDPPAHDETRAITFQPLTPRALEAVRVRVTDTAERIAEAAVAKGRIEVVADLARPLPLAIVRDLVGLGEYGKARMLNWASATFEMMGDPRDRRGTAAENLAALRAFLEDPDMLAALSEDGWARRATRRATEAGIAPDRAVALMRDYIAPSLDTTISAIGYGVMLFARHPAQWEMLRADRALMRNAIEEIVRLNTPIKTLSRMVVEDVVLEGIRIPAGSRTMMLFGAANRDAAKFPAPDRFDIERSTRGHVGFGHGVHSCLGMHLARLEMTCLFSALADRVAAFKITAAPVMAKNSTIHSLKSLTVDLQC